MSIRKTMIMFVIVAFALVILAGVLQATPPISRHLFDWKLEPVELPKTPGVIDLLFEFTPTKLCSAKGCTEAEIRVLPQLGLEYQGPQTWTQQVKYGETYSQVIQVTVPPNDTVGIWIELHSPVYSRTRAVAYFTTTIDSVDFWKGYPQGSSSGPSQGERMRARMTPEQLQEVVTVRLSFLSRHRLVVARVNDLVDELVPTDEDNVFICRVSRDVWATLLDLPITCGIIDEPPPPQPDSSPPSGRTIDSLGKQGFLEEQRKITADGAFAAAGVWPLTSEGKMPPDVSITIFVECLNNTGYNQRGITNGFRVYSPEGATWNESVGDTLGTRLS